MQAKLFKTNKYNTKLFNELSLISSRLSLKKFSADDVDVNVQHEIDSELMRYIRDPLPTEEARKQTIEISKYWSGNEKDWCLISIRQQVDNEFIGILSFRYESIENDTVEIGWRLGQTFQGKGYATEAAQALLDFLKTEIKPHKVVAYCVAENLASSKIMAKLNMQKEGQLRQYSKLGGKWHDEAIYGLIFD